MDYELASELKQAGFPQGGTGTWTFPPHNLVARHADRVYVPTLSELIAECAEGFEKLEKIVKDAGAIQSGNTWQAVAASEVEYGATPEDAVARLWLTFNRNS